MGNVVVTIDETWLQGQSSNNITLYFFPVNADFDEPVRVTGPTVTVTMKPLDIHHQEPAKVPTNQSLYIALPTVFGFILLCVVGGFFWNRKSRKISIGSVIGGKRGYGTGKSKAQRMGLTPKNGISIQLQDQEASSGAVHVRHSSEALGSLAGTPTEEKKNYFREELQRQEQESRSHKL